MSLSKDYLEQLYHGTVSVKQHLAEQLYAQHGAALHAHEVLNEDLKELKQLAGLLHEHMAKMRLGELCVQCATVSGGGCCSLFMAGETDGIQMLMNLLVGGKLAQVRDDGVECCFLGEQGCIFLFKPMFCLNYNCKKIHDTACAEDMAYLEKLTGRLLGKQHEVEQRILALLNRS